MATLHLPRRTSSALAPLLIALSAIAAHAEVPRSKAVIRVTAEADEPTGPALVAASTTTTEAGASPPQLELQIPADAPSDELVVDAPSFYDAPPGGAQAVYEFEPPSFESTQNHHHHRPLRAPARAYQYWQNRPRQATLATESWLNRPYNLQFFVGGMFLDDPQTGVVDGDAGVMLGGRLGWDFSPHWGVEGRIAIAQPGLESLVGMTDVANADIFLADFNYLWYPTGDTLWRPFFKVGLGYFDLEYNNGLGINQHNASLEIPFGVGLKYHHSTRLTMRFDVTDNFVCKTGAQDSMHNLSVTTGFEWHFGGGTRRNYWPWNPGRDYR